MGAFEIIAVRHVASAEREIEPQPSRRAGFSLEPVFFGVFQFALFREVKRRRAAGKQFGVAKVGQIEPKRAGDAAGDDFTDIFAECACKEPAVRSGHVPIVFVGRPVRKPIKHTGEHTSHRQTKSAGDSGNRREMAGQEPASLGLRSRPFTPKRVRSFAVEQFRDPDLVAHELVDQRRHLAKRAFVRHLPRVEAGVPAQLGLCDHPVRKIMYILRAAGVQVTRRKRG